ncbi:hypothetical protein LTR84_003659 [Exophiala bonariae]|uniref:Uncharacterized protein n=1 Tax=Exophiala bonariae TaxID=1690606 RepID=A0AAV9N637_9EURO|nr:hypothetical protein LTR84_003659 [Exophiala bonariae]
MYILLSPAQEEAIKKSWSLRRWLLEDDEINVAPGAPVSSSCIGSGLGGGIEEKFSRAAYQGEDKSKTA